MNKIKTFDRLQQFFAFSFLIVGLAWLFISLREHRSFFGYYIIGGVGLFYAFIALAMFFYKTHSKAIFNFLFLLAILNYGYILVETFAYFYMCVSSNFRNTTFFSKPCTEFDKISGYRWKENPCRIVRIANGEVIFDHLFRANRQGYISNKDYLYRKPNHNIIRYLVLGDSFTASEYLQIPWPDRIEEIINNSSNEQKYEFYSFAINGGGLSNWHEIFFKEIIANYEFDGIIIACFIDNLYRKFTIFYIDETGGYFDRFLSIPKDNNDFMLNYFPRMKKEFYVVKEDELDSHIRNFIQSPFVPQRLNLYILSHFIKMVRTINAQIIMKKSLIIPRTYVDVREKIGKLQFKKLEKIIQWCRVHNKQVILVSIPPIDGITQSNPTLRVYEKDLRLIAEGLEIAYYNGYRVFSDLSPNEVKQHWLPYDGHWNQEGSDRFAQYLAWYIKQEAQIKD